VRQPGAEAAVIRREGSVLSRIAYTESELRQVNEEVWSHPPTRGQEKTGAICPACGAHALVLVAWSGTGEHCGAEVLKVTCKGCDRHGTVRPVESRCADFDSDQMQQIVELHLRGQTAFCPTCSTPLHVLDAHTLGERHYSAYCHRGGAMGQLAIAR